MTEIKWDLNQGSLNLNMKALPLSHPITVMQLAILERSYIDLTIRLYSYLFEQPWLANHTLHLTLTRGVDKTGYPFRLTWLANHSLHHSIYAYI